MAFKNILITARRERRRNGNDIGASFTCVFEIAPRRKSNILQNGEKKKASSHNNNLPSCLCFLLCRLEEERDVLAFLFQSLVINQWKKVRLFKGYSNGGTKADGLHSSWISVFVK